MRLHFQLSPNKQPVPFDYQHQLTGRFHRWLGENSLHEGISLYSLGWLRGGGPGKDGLNFPDGATWFVSSHDDSILERLVISAMREAELCFGMEIQGVRWQKTPNFGPRFTFKAGSPILARSKEVEGRVTHLLHSDEAADEVLTHILRHKMDAAKLGEEHKSVTVGFDRSYRGAKTKLVTIKGIGNRASLCPVIVEGTPEAVQFAWEVGIGHLTGNGFGSLI